MFTIVHLYFRYTCHVKAIQVIYEKNSQKLVYHLFKYGTKTIHTYTYISICELSKALYVTYTISGAYKCSAVWLDKYKCSDY